MGINYGFKKNCGGGGGPNVKNILNPDMDNKIRTALKNADKQGKLNIVAVVVGIAGGVDTLREIMNSEGELSVMDRGMLGMHLDV